MGVVKGAAGGGSSVRMDWGSQYCTESTQIF